MGLKLKSGKFVGDIQERDQGSGDDSTTAFGLSQTASANPQLRVYLNGLLQELTTDYTFGSNTVTFVTAPRQGQSIEILYLKD